MPIPLQNHIHVALAIGGAPESAPIWKWAVKDRLLLPEVAIEITRTLNGRLRYYVQQDDDGIVRHDNLKFTVRVRATEEFDLETRVNQLISMKGKLVYVCDSFHANDGTSHVATTKTYFMKDVAAFSPVSYMLPFFEVDVELEDASRP